MNSAKMKRRGILSFAAGILLMDIKNLTDSKDMSGIAVKKS